MTHFNIRVYGIYIQEGKVLVSDEFRAGMRMTKFPGGGLEFGEGTIQALERECIEEFGQAFRIMEHFYTTDFFIASAFNNKQQLISIYYLMEPLHELKLSIANKAFDFDEVEGAQSFRWLAIDAIELTSFTFPIDQHVGELIRQKWLN